MSSAEEKLPTRDYERSEVAHDASIGIGWETGSIGDPLGIN
jgi:hypothetical protein